MEYVRWVAFELNDAVARYVLVLLASIEINQTDRTIGAVLTYFQVIFNNVLFHLEPNILSERDEPLFSKGR